MHIYIYTPTITYIYIYITILQYLLNHHPPKSCDSFSQSIDQSFHVATSCNSFNHLCFKVEATELKHGSASEQWY